MRYLLFYFLVHLIRATPQINLYGTYISTVQNPVQQHCLRVAAALDQWNINRQIISYCLTHSLSYFHREDQNSFLSFTFDQLSQANITTKQLYHWSAPIDLIEDYQIYLDQTSIVIRLTLGKTVFYNCTLPRFGPFCQYQFDFYHPNHASLYEMIYDFYLTFPYEPTEFTCYTHLECNRGRDPSCLDWTEICDGKIDCSNGGIDEEHCWQLEVNECSKDEYRCLNGQCIPRSFYLDDSITPDCLDQTDEQRERLYPKRNCNTKEPSLACVDIACTGMTLTSSCSAYRTNLLVKVMFSIEDNNVSSECSRAIRCALGASEWHDLDCVDLCENFNYVFVIDRTCPMMTFIPVVPALFNEVYFAYEKDPNMRANCGSFLSPYECVDTNRYHHFYPNTKSFIVGNRTCFYRVFPRGTDGVISWVYAYATPIYQEIHRFILLWNYSTIICNRSSMYQCLDSPKCISIHRLMDGNVDCPLNDDEDLTSTHDPITIERMKSNAFYCQTTNKYISLTSMENGLCDCIFADGTWCEDENLDMNYFRRNISFQTICDGFTELVPLAIDGRNETDETECEQWLCDNIYTRCNGFWNCRNGEDEIGCLQSSSLSCSSDQHLCVANRTFELECLSIDKVNDGHVDCIGATDEQRFCHRKETIIQINNFYCQTNRSVECLRVYNLCDKENNCIYGDDEEFCRKRRPSVRGNSLCQLSFPLNLTEAEQFLCDYTSQKLKKQIVRFSLDQTTYLFTERSVSTMNNTISLTSWINRSQIQNVSCHRGLDLRIWSNDQQNSSSTACLCPPSYYGDRCQYQNQRIVLSIQFRVSSDSHHTPFAILISLFDHDDKRLIHSYEQFTYLSVRDCQVKFSVYLLYSSQPKDPKKHYSIQIDIYDKQALIHRGSLLMPIRFPFLPVHRLSFIADIPAEHESVQSCSTDTCDHGKCVRYSRSVNNDTFCQCNRGWTGRSCSIAQACQCADDAICAGVDVNNRSVCICPLHRFGPRCFLRHTVCSTNVTCQNGGKCISNDEIAPFTDTFTCICRKGYTGQRCETIENGLLLSFEPNIISTQSIFIHFIRVMNNEHPQRTTTLRTFPFRQESLLVHWSQPFHLVFIEFPNHNYYFTLAQNTFNGSTIITKTIHASDRCRHVRELFNETIIQLHPLRRIKHYQIPCQREAPDLMCFYDDIHLCLCQDHRRYRVANCFEFNHNMTFNCLGQSVCQNDAQCFQDSPRCPQRSICICPACYYGTRCQFTTSIFSLSLDAILGYHIQPSIILTKQPLIVQISVVLIIIFICFGFANGTLTLITFLNKDTRKVGCGYYLFYASITTLVITIMFGLKFFILLLSQMQVIVNRSFLSFQCHSIDFILRCSLNMAQWLNACVAIERAVTMVKGARFNKKKSRQTAKLILCILLIVIIATGIDDPIHRRLIDEENEDERRIWCVVSYSATFQALNTAINIFHFVTPFLLNLLSTIILIIQKSRQKANLERDRRYNQILRAQLGQYKHLLIAPIVLMILAGPHLILSVVSQCMKFNSNSWLYFIGYLIPFIPPMLTIILFVLPSEFYRKELRTTIVRYRRNVTRRFHTVSSA